MSCKCDPSRKSGGECWCKNAPPLPAGSPRRALNPSICSRDTQCRSGFRPGSSNIHEDGTTPATPKTFMTRDDQRSNRPTINFPINCEDDEHVDAAHGINTSCISLQYRRRAPCAKSLSLKSKKPRCPARGPEPLEKLPPCRDVEEDSGKRRKRLPPGGRKSPHRPDECATGVNVKVPCGISAENYEDSLASEMLRNRKCYDQGAYNSDNSSTNLSYRPDSRTHSCGKPCMSDKRRQMLKKKLRELLKETQPIPQRCLLENSESKPEPEILAEVLLMSEAEGIDLAEIKPDNVFDNLFADMSFGRPITITSAAPGSTMSSVVVPIHVPGEETTSFEIPNIDSVMENTRNEIPPNTNAFKQSTGYETFSGHMSELLNRTPATENIHEFLGSSTIDNDVDGTQTTHDSILDYVIKPGPAAHTNRVQLNGSVKPIWFPGYILVSPRIPGCIRMTDDPGEALKEAWGLCRPKHFHEDSRYLVDIG